MDIPTGVVEIYMRVGVLPEVALTRVSQLLLGVSSHSDCNQQSMCVATRCRRLPSPTTRHRLADRSI